MSILLKLLGWASNPRRQLHSSSCWLEVGWVGTCLIRRAQLCTGSSYAVLDAATRPCVGVRVILTARPSPFGDAGKRALASSSPTLGHVLQLFFRNPPLHRAPLAHYWGRRRSVAYLIQMLRTFNSHPDCPHNR